VAWNRQGPLSKWARNSLGALEFFSALPSRKILLAMSVHGQVVVQVSYSYWSRGQYYEEVRGTQSAKKGLGSVVDPPPTFPSRMT